MADTLYKNGAELLNVSSSETPQHHKLCEVSLENLCSRQDEFIDMLPQLLPECVHQDTLTSALIAACKHRCTRAAQLLVSKGADVNGCDAKGNSPLCAAFARLKFYVAPSSQLVTLLLKAGADPNASHKGLTALWFACDWDDGQFEIASKLIDAGADTNPKSCSPLQRACEENHIDIIELLLENRADPNWSSPEGHILNVVHETEQYEVVRLLLEYGAEPSVLSGIGLKAACELGYTEVARHIINESCASSYVLEQCIEGAHKNGFLEALLEAIMDTSKQDIKDCCIPLVHALISGETHTLADAVQETPVNVSDDMQLWGCLKKRDIAKMRVLIKGGHDVNTPNDTGRSLLQECIQQRITHVIPDLCTSQIHIDHRDSAGRTALFYSLACPHMYPVRRESISVFEYLVSKRCKGGYYRLLWKICSA